MRLSLSRSGGFTGVKKPPQVIEAEELSAPHRAKLKKLLAQVQAAAPNSKTPPAMPDRFDYQLTVDRPGEKPSVLHLHEASLPPGASELLDLIQSSARKK